MTNIESKILRSVITYNDKLPLFFQTLKKEYFSSQGQEIYQIIWDIFTNNSQVELTYISEICSNKEAITKLLEQIPTKNVEQYYSILIDDYNIYQRIMLVDELKKNEGKRNVDLSLIFEKFTPKTATKYMTLKQRLQYIAENNIKFEKYELGVNFLDVILYGGIELHQLVLISGDFESGKSSLCLQIIRNLAKNYKCAYFCFEFPADKYAVGEEKILNRLLNQNTLTYKDMESIQENIYIIDEGMNVDDTAANILFLASCGVKFFVIDSQMRLNVEQAMNVEESESRKFSILNNLCNKYGIVIFLIVQTSKNDNKSPLGSKKGGHEASIMIRIEHNDVEVQNKQGKKVKDKKYPFDPNSRTIIVQKNKQTGKHAQFKVDFDTTNQTFSSSEIVDYDEYKKEKNTKNQNTFSLDSLDSNSFPTF